MKFKLFFEYKGGFVDELLVEGESLKEIQAIAKAEREKRNPQDCWSERVEP